MSQKKFCIELAFTGGPSYSQQMKVKDFWKYIDTAKPLEPHEVTPEEQVSTKNDSGLPKCKRKWYTQLKIFKEHGLDKVALAAANKCTLCSRRDCCRNSDCTDTLEESYDELLKDMKVFDEKLDERSKSNTESIFR